MHQTKERELWLYILLFFYFPFFVCVKNCELGNISFKLLTRNLTIEACIFVMARHWQGGGDVEVSGSPTEKAILQWGINVKLLTYCYLLDDTLLPSLSIIVNGIIILQLGMNFNAVRSNSSIIHAFPFNSEKKRGGVAVQLVMGLCMA